MKVRLGGVAVVGFLAVASVASGEAIVGATFGSGGTAYWNNSSKDASSASVCYNIGCVLSEPSLVGTTTPVNTALLSWATSGGAIPTDFYISAGGEMFTFSVLQNSSLNGITFGWYDTATQTQHALFSSAGNAGCLVAGAAGCIADPSIAPVALTLSGNFGFYVLVDYHNGYQDTYFTQTNLNTSSGVVSAQVGAQHFALFQKSGSYYIGAEDSMFWDSTSYGPSGPAIPALQGLDLVEGRGDFQDFLVKISVTSVPEPSTIGFILLGLGGLAGLRFRRR